MIKNTVWNQHLALLDEPKQKRVLDLFSDMKNHKGVF